MPVIYLDSLSFSALAPVFKLLPSKHKKTTIWHAREFASTLQETSISPHRSTRVNKTLCQEPRLYSFTSIICLQFWKQHK